MTNIKNSRTSAHTRYYLKNGDLVVGVTTALGILNKPGLVVWANRLGLQGVDSTKVRDQAGDRGTITHLLICSELKNCVPDLSQYSQSDIDVATLCLDSFHEWRKSHTLEVIHVETPMQSEMWRYGGTPDFLGYINGELTLMDFKTSNAIYNDYFYQVAAYRQLEIEAGYSVNKARILRFSKGDNVEFEDRMITQFDKEFALFTHCLAIYNLLKKMNRSL